jgi:branched-chain amino acid aminotransferase
MNHAYNNYPAWQNGIFCTVQDLTISILDLGLIHSDATYDVMAFVNHQGLKIQEHVDRFVRSCEYWRINMNCTKQELMDVAHQLHQSTGWSSSIIWVSVTRGVPESGNPRDLTNCRPNLMMYAKPYQQFNGTGRTTVCLSTQRRIPDWGVNQLHKNFVWSDLTRAQWEAIDQGYDTAVLMSTDGYLTEGPGFNVAIVENGVVYAPSSNRLPGISMLLIEETCTKNKIKFVWDTIDQLRVENCDDMFLTTTVGNIVTVTNLNGRLLTQSDVQKTLIKIINKEKENA